MTVRQNAVLVALLAVAPGICLGQSTDAAAERARLGNERIQAEAERQAREEALRHANRTPVVVAAPIPAQTAPSQPATGTSLTPTPSPPVHADRTDRALEQLRELGRLKDAGYLTDAEFQRIKQRILDSHF